ncbi:MAG: hypothetical protein AAFP78_15715 [Pseudomonadota bacterium]
MGFSVVIGAGLLLAKGWKERMGALAGVLALAAVLAYALRLIEGAIP